jgi:hypothetical protein
MNKNYYLKKVILKPKEIMADPKVDTNDENNFLDIGTEVRVQLDKPVDALTGKKLHGANFREGDTRWSKKISTITRAQIIPNQPIFYKVKGYTPLFTKNQLQVVNTDKANLPPASIQYKHVIKEILEKKKLKLLHFLVIILSSLLALNISRLYLWPMWGESNSNLLGIIGNNSIDFFLYPNIYQIALLITTAATIILSIILLGNYLYNFFSAKKTYKHNYKS